MTNSITIPFADRRSPALDQRGPLRVMFVITSMPVGGAETLLVSLVRGFAISKSGRRIAPQICCLKERGPLGEMLSEEVPVHFGLIRGKYDAAVLLRLRRLLKSEQIDAVVTVGAGDKMFWGRLAARWAQVPVIVSALHSTGWPDGVGRLNRLLTPITDAFIAVAQAHGRHLIDGERFPSRKVHVIPNGVDTERFRPQQPNNKTGRERIRAELGISADAPTVGIVAALRPEKNHRLFLRAASIVRTHVPKARFLIVGDGALRSDLEQTAAEHSLENDVIFLGNRNDIPEILAAMDVFVLTSDNEANPVSILEAMAVGLPIVSTRVGSIAEVVQEGVTGFLTPPGNPAKIAEQIADLLANPAMAAKMGAAGRERVVSKGSLASMVAGYEDLLTDIYAGK